MRVKILALLVTTALFVTTASAWSITSTSVVPDVLNDNDNVIVTMRVLNDNGQPVDPHQCENVYTRYFYNSQSSEPMTHIPNTDGFYYVNLPVNDNDDTIDLEAEGINCPDFNDGTANATLSVDTTGDINLGVENQTAYTTDANMFLEGTTYDFYVNATYQGNPQNVSMNWSINGHGENYGGRAVETNGTSYRNPVNLPADSRGLYYLIFEAQNTSKAYNNPFGGYAMPIFVEEKLESSLSITDLNNACDDNISSCQKGANLTLTFNEIDNDANDVEAVVRGKNNTLLLSTTLERVSTSEWQTNITIPSDLNTTEYGTELIVGVRGTNELSESIKTKTIDIDPFDILSDTSSYVFKGNDIDLQFGPVHPYTKLPLGRNSTAAMDLVIAYPDGSIAVNTTLTAPFSDSNYLDDQKLFSYTYGVPLDAPAGEYRFQVNLTDPYGYYELSDQFTFRVHDSSATGSNVEVTDISSGINELDSTDEIEKSFFNTGLKQGNIVVRNSGEAGAVVGVHTSGNLSGNTTTATPDQRDSMPFALASGTAEVIKFGFNLTEFANYTGDITLTINDETNLNYNITLPVRFNVQQRCQHVRGVLCLRTDTINRTFTDETQQTIVLRIRNLNTTSATNVSYITEGNISDILPSGLQRIRPNREKILEIKFDTLRSMNGFYSGNITLTNSENDVIRLPTHLDLAIPEGDIGVTVIGGTDFGYYVKGQQISFDVQIENVGPVTIRALHLKVPAIGMEKELNDDLGNPLSLDPGESATRTVTIDTSNADAGDYSDTEITLEAQSGVSGSTTINFGIAEDLEGELSSLDNSISSLRSDVDELDASSSEKGSISGDIDSLESLTQEAQTAWDNGNYQEAQQKATEAENLKSQIETDISDLEASPPADPGDTGSGGQDGPGSDPGSDTDNGGGFNIMFLLIPLVVILVVGVVIYLSIVPEEEGNAPSYMS